MATVTYDDRSFLVDGQRIWLVSGSVHYFRTPAALWRDRLLKARQAGLNCISTHVAWNFHEPREGQWEFSDDHDVAAFVRLAGELGLYVILRPGPYISGELDFGGLPAWLAAKPNLAYRSSNAAYTHYFDKYFRAVLPSLADLQVTRGGSVILIQNENDYGVTTMPDRLAYLEFISQLFRRSGFDIPIINCNGFTEPPVPDTIECVNGQDGLIQKLKRMRLRQPNGPLLVTELRATSADTWGCSHETPDGCAVARRAMETLGCGAQYNYYPWHGGTNFGFWGGRSCRSDAQYQTTSNDCGAPLAEGGGARREYYLTRLVNMLALHMGHFFASSLMEEPGVTVHDNTTVLNLTGPLAHWAVVTNGGRRDITTARISLPEGQELTVSLEPFGAAAVPVELDLSSTQMLDYSNLTPLGLFGQKVLVLHGPSGFEARVSINGREVRCKVPDGDEVQLLEHEEMFLLFINSELAMRTWLVEDSLVLGPQYVGQSLSEITISDRAKQYHMLSLAGELTVKKVKSTPARRATAPRLGQWRRLSVCTEPVATDLQWHKMDRPRDVDHLGLHYGYVWYRIECEHPRPRKRHLFLPDCEDRATIFLNGDHVGVWGRGEGAGRKPIPAAFERGRNVLAFLVDNLGRFSDGAGLGERKGLFGHVYDAKLLRTVKFKLKELEGLSKRVIPRQLTHLVTALERMPVWAADVDIRLNKVMPIHLSFTDVPHHVAVLCNDRSAGMLPNYGANFGDVTLGSELKKGKNTIRLLLWGQVKPKVLENVKFHMLEESLSAGATWSYRPWSAPQEGDPIVGKDQPAWYTTAFKCAERDTPLFLHIVGARKGQIFLNGHNLGRFWTIGPQQYYYLPSCWLADENQLLLFEEDGRIPTGSKLAFRALGPYAKP